ncbi:hypothetical protein F8A88_10555 [Pseudodesulfovibrio senegalensis]|uniref:Uncharacterized protein n=2 Tax=Pseudodesulfovibrio senegalensis TaxID=1721087 RepID=A0A6N6N0K3_9BACT|nr:hypothetical protein F8A88_10555 [Pseudodesulfovibrio senegalensis]
MGDAMHHHCSIEPGHAENSHDGHEHAHGEECGHCHHGHHGHEHHHHHHHQGVPGPRTGARGILLTAFGCAHEQAHEYYGLFEREVREKYPDMDVRWAFTANRIRGKIRSRGMDALSVGEALSRMVDDGVSHVAVQSLHTLPGVEYDWTVQQAEAMLHPRKGLADVTVGAPLLRSVDDMKRAAEVVAVELMPMENDNDGVILVGHGTYHEGHALYLALEGLLLRSHSNVAMGTLMSSRAPAELGQRFWDKGVKRIFLVPFMCVPGHHVHVDLFGDNEHSWLHGLSSMGLDVVPVHTGSLAHAGFRGIWHDHLAEAVAGLSE